MIDLLLDLKTINKDYAHHLTFLIVCTLAGGTQRAIQSTTAVHTPHTRKTGPGQPVSPASPVPPLTGVKILP